MRIRPGTTLQASLGACLMILLPATFLPAQEGQGQKVRFHTGDGVEIQGKFYPSLKRNGPCVIMLHALGEDSSKAGWDKLAQAFHKKGFAVLTFDFRGHGNSQTVDPVKFWAQAFNRNNIKGAPNSDTIEFKQFPKSYYTALANDIAAARAFLDRKNDAGDCNTSSIVLVGADTGATVGALWLNSEWYRFRAQMPLGYNLPQFLAPGMSVPVALPVRAENKAAGKDVVACVWLSISAKLGTVQLSLSNLLAKAGKENYTPMLFVYGDGDSAGEKTAKACVKAIKGTDKSNKYEYTGPYPIVDGGKSVGRELLKGSLPTEKSVVTWADQVVQSKGGEWEERDFSKSAYVWKSPNQPSPLILGNRPGDKSLAFSTYSQFLK